MKNVNVYKQVSKITLIIKLTTVKLWELRIKREPRRSTHLQAGPDGAGRVTGRPGAERTGRGG